MVGINPIAIYGEEAAAVVTGFTRSEVIHARQAGRLQFLRVGPRRRLVYRGAWLLAWLESMESDEAGEATWNPRPGA